MDLDTAYAFGRFRLLPARRQLLADGQPVALGSRALDLLQALVERRERTVAKAELLDAVWPEVVVEEANLHVHISALRKALGPAAIATVPGRGYRFVAPLHDEPAPPGAAATLPDPSSPAAALPPPSTPLIGREDALAALATLVRGHPLVTLTGPGGIGKTCLALALGHAQGAQWPDGVAWVELAATRDATQVAPAVAQALRLPPGAPADVPRVAAALQGKAMLLLLDNGEHLLGAIVALVQALRQSAPQVHVLLTSQEALRVPGEQVFALPPLALPAAHEAANDRFGAIALFVERARAADRHFTLDMGNAEAVAEVCRRLDGLPLAIELAAARVPLLGVHGLRERLDERLRLLTRGARTALPRHQALRAALSWSHSLLGPAEQTVLRRLGVFAGGFTLELAQVVAADDGEGGALDAWAVLDALSALVDKSLVSVDAGEPLRYRLLETMRVFALEQLDAAGERERLQQRHAHAVAALFARADESRFGDGGTGTAHEVTQQLQPELDNARAALAWATRVQDWPLTASLAGSAAALYHALGLIHELLPVLRACVPHLAAAAPSAQVNVLWRLGTVGLFGGIGHEELQQLKRDAVDLARRRGLRRRLQVCLAALGFTLARRGDEAGAQAISDELQALERPTDPVYIRALRLSVPMMLAQHRGDTEAVVANLAQQRALLLGAPDELVPLMTCESNMALHLNALGRHEEAARLGLALLARADLPRTLVHVACVSAYALSCLGRVDEARQIVAQRRREIEATPITAFSGEALGLMCLAAGRLDDAVRIDAALRHRTAHDRGTPHPATLAFRARLADAVAQAGVAAETLERWRRDGEVLTDAAAVELALR